MYGENHNGNVANRSYVTIKMSLLSGREETRHNMGEVICNHITNHGMRNLTVENAYSNLWENDNSTEKWGRTAEQVFHKKETSSVSKSRMLSFIGNKGKRN